MSVEVIEEQTVELEDLSDNSLALCAARSMACEIGFNDVDQSLVATAVSELSTNIVRYGNGGCVHIRHIISEEGAGVEIEALDNGPGIENLEKAMEDNYSTASSLGLGLPGVRRIMDEFAIESSSENGTRCLVRKWRRS